MQWRNMCGHQLRQLIHVCFLFFFKFNVNLTELIAWLHLPEALLSSSQLMVWTMMALHALLFRRWRCTICLLIGCCRSLPVDLLKIREDKKHMYWRSQLDVCGELQHFERSIALFAQCVYVFVCAGHGFSFHHNLSLKSSCCRAHDEHNLSKEKLCRD